MSKIISRTIRNNVATVLKVNLENKTVEEKKIPVDSRINTVEKAVSFFAKDRTIVSVLAVDSKEILLGMEESTFFANAEKFEERSKDTRNLITKNVIVEFAHCLVVEGREVKESIVPMNTENKLKKFFQESGKIFVKVESVEKIEQLCGMSEEKFISLAKPMKDRFTLA